MFSILHHFSFKRIRTFFLYAAAFCIVPGSNYSYAEDVHGFTEFIQKFSHESQEKASYFWNRASDTMPADILPEIVFDQAEVLDEEFFAELTPENRASAEEKLNELYPKIAEAVIKRDQLIETVYMWTVFSESIENHPELGKVYLQSLIQRNEAKSRLESAAKKVRDYDKQVVTIRENISLSHISRNFTTADWIVIAVYLIFTTILGGILAGKQASMKDFFLGGRRLPWPAVCGSIMATELSAATFLIAPAIVFSRGGDMTYIQLAMGTILARFIIGYFFVPVYYKREIYSPYDYMGNELGPRVKNITSILFMIGGILAQGARVYIAAKALQVITGTNISTSIIIIGIVSIGWTMMGGITTVIWTDAIQFVLFTLGTIAAMIFMGTAIDGGLITILREGMAADKFRMINLDFNLKEAYLLWCGLFATGFLTLGSHGTDQLMAQRMFTCKSEKDARKAVIWSSSVLITTLMLLFVGAGLFVYYKYLPFNKAEQVIVNADSMKVFAIYIVNVMPSGLSGLLMAAIFATAISTLTSILAALSQTIISIFYKPFIKSEASERHYVKASRVFVLIWGIFLTGFAISCHFIAQYFVDLIQFALAMAAYTYGALLGTFLLAFLKTGKDDTGLMWSVPMSILIVFAFNWHQPAAQLIVLAVCLVLIIQAVRWFRNEPKKVVYIGIGISMILFVSMAVIGYTPEGLPVHVEIAWPWHYPIGTAMTFFIGYLAGKKKQ